MDNLRDAALAMFESADGELAQLDSGFIGELASVPAPEGLRDQILDAIEAEQKAVLIRRSPRIFKWASSAPSAAFIAKERMVSPRSS